MQRAARRELVAAAEGRAQPVQEGLSVHLGEVRLRVREQVYGERHVALGVGLRRLTALLAAVPLGVVQRLAALVNVVLDEPREGAMFEYHGHTVWLLWQSKQAVTA